MRAEKGNKVYTITEEQKEYYQNDGFDIFSDDGEIIAYGTGKNVPYEKYAALKKENEVLKEKLAETETPQADEKARGIKDKACKK